MPADTGFGLGFFCGMLLGAIGVYLVVTPEGKQLKQRLSKEFLSHQQTFTLESVIPQSGKKSQSRSSFASDIHALITKAKKYFQEPNNHPTSKTNLPSVSVKKKHVFKKK